MTGNEHLDKAKGALDHARDLVQGLGEGEVVQDNPKLHKEYLSLIDLASVQACLAQAEALTRIAAIMERKSGYNSPGPVPQPGEPTMNLLEKS